MTEVCSAGFPHSDISGSLDICSSPKLFAAYHVFHRLLVPRHPPYAGFPHSDISGSLDICSSPKLFAAYHVFHRLLVPRHPPYALSSITNSLRPLVWTPLHISSVICVGNSLLFLFVFSNQFSFLLLQASMITSDVLIFFLSRSTYLA